MINIQEGSDISSGTLDSETSELERQLKQVPNIMEFRKPALLPSNRKPVFRWDHRMLVEEVVIENVTEKRKGRYYMYKCTDPSLGLPANRLFVEQYGCSVYGDAFIFMLKESEPDGSGGLSPAKMDWQIDWYDIRFFFAPLAKKRDPTLTA